MSSMRYEDSTQVSAEYLRLTLPMISKHSLGANPVNYAVMYEYVAGTNPALCSVIDEKLANGDSLDDATTEKLFRSHILSADAQRLEQFQGDLVVMVRQLENSVKTADDEAHRFSDSLVSCDQQLKQEPNAVAAVLKDLVSHTQQMRSVNAALQSSLEQHAEEAATLRQQLESARKEAVTDALTGLLNRAGFDKAVEEIMAERHRDEHGICLMMVDIDHFKNVNDTYGHLFGDKVIKIVAQLLRKSVKGKDAAARFGGEEFVVMLPDTPIAGAIAVADNIRRALARVRIRRAHNGETIGNITLSAGVAAMREGEELEAVIERADAALYKSKNGGRNQVTSAEEG